MSTFTVTGVTATSTDGGASIAALDSATLEIFMRPGRSTFYYTIEDLFPNDLPEVDIEIDEIDIRLDGVSIEGDDQFVPFLGAVEWGGNTTVVLAISQNPAPNTEIDSIFVLGGAALPDFADAAAFETFLAGVTGLGPASGDFAPSTLTARTLISLTEIPGVVEGQLPAFPPQQLDGDDGDDSLSGDNGDDDISGGFGNDNLSGDDGDDHISGNDDNDTISGGYGNDSLSGDDGDDSLSGDDGDDDISGGLGSDDLSGGSGKNRLLGDDGNDTLTGGDDTDTLNGGNDDDRIIGGLSESDLRDLIFAGSGNDNVDGGYGNDDINGMDGDDTMVGGFGSDREVGGAGQDVVSGGALSDLLFGNDGDDFLNGGFGFDRVNGGAGSDKFFHAGVAGHGSDWIQDLEDVDILVFGQAGATIDQFQVNIANTAGAGDDAVDEAFVIYRPTGQIVWALVDGADNTAIDLQIAGSAQIFDLMDA